MRTHAAEPTALSWPLNVADKYNDKLDMRGKALRVVCLA